MLVDVVILNWNAPDDTLACLRNLAAWQSVSLRIWVVDNASSDDSVARIQTEFPHINFIRSDQNRGFAGGNNLALAAILDSNDSEMVLLLNNDATVAEPELRKLLGWLEMRPDLGVLGPALWNAQFPERLLSAGGRDVVRYVVSHWRDLPAEPDVRVVDYVPGTCVLIRAAVLRDVGLLDEDYFFAGEVADLCRRARQAEWVCAVDTAARAEHHLARSSEIREQLHIYYVLRNRFIFIRKFYAHQRWRWFAFWTGYGLYVALSALVHRQWRRARAIVLGVWDGLRGHYGGQNARILGRARILESGR